MHKQLTYTDAIPRDSALLSRTSFASKRSWGYPEEWMSLWKTDLEVTEDYISKNKVVKVFDAEVFIGFFAIIHEEENTATIDHFWLVPQKLKQNYGREIFKYIMEYASSRDYERLSLVAEPNAKGFYEKMNGTIIGQFESKIRDRFLDIYEFPIIRSDDH